MINIIIEWFRNFSLFRVKVGMVIIVVPAVTFDINVKADLFNRTFEFIDGSLSFIAVITIEVNFIFARTNYNF